MKRLKAQQVPTYRKSLAAGQGNTCPVCGRHFEDAYYCYKTKRIKLAAPPTLDHSHQTGHIRGVLCRACNTLEGKVRKAHQRYGANGSDLIDVLYNLAEYLQEHELPDDKPLHPKFKTEDEKRLARNKRAKQNRDARKALKEAGL